MNINGVTYASYDEARIETFMLKARVKRLRLQLAEAERRGFSTTKVPLDLLRSLLNLVA